MYIRIKRHPYEMWLKRYEEVGLPAEGRIAIMRDNKWGFIDELGVEVIPPIYDEVGDFKPRWFQNIYCEVLAQVRIKVDGMCTGDFGYINLQGVVVIPIRYKKVVYTHSLNDLRNSLSKYLEDKAQFTLLDKPDDYLFMNVAPRKKTYHWLYT
jgi:hypothetical protein